MLPIFAKPLDEISPDDLEQLVDERYPEGSTVEFKRELPARDGSEDPWVNGSDQILDHEQLIKDIRAAGARIRLIGDGDLSAAISAALVGSGVHAAMGTGGAPEGVLAAAAMRCLNGEIFGRLIIDTPEKQERARSMGITDFKKVYRAADLASGERIIFAATGVTEGTFMKGVRFFGEGCRTSSLVMQTSPHRIQFIETIHVREDAAAAGLRF